jgi:dipeptidase D
MDTLATYSFEPAQTPESSIAFKVLVNGLVGGHSGDEIHKGLGNSIKILNRFLWEATKKFGIRVHCFSGGNLRNAIPREAWSVFVIKKEQATELEDFHSKFSEIIRNEFAITEPNLGFSIETFNFPEYVLDKKFQDSLLDSLYACPHGAIAMSQEIHGLVETSTNLASINFNENHIEITTSQRSSVESAKIDVSQMVESCFKLSGASVVHTGNYPGWTPNTNSRILEISASAYKRLFKTEPKVKAIHAGLECGLFLEKYPQLDMISFGPTIRGAHSPDEKLNIESTYNFWDLLVEILRNIPNNS